ncbi:MAG TPA: type IV toxin-antitoxin system AbiEi family antitoxin [Conexibacter sp.]|jgi:predicted transcriptional regulator of viral defense system|nr:type IV toxin-antitoxin system AbiEi family antitoxin [Conexibacter sp.]
MPSLAPHDLPDHLLSTGVNTFTLADATRLLQRREDAVRKGLERLRRKRLIFSPARGFYVVIPPQFRRHGTVPATHFIDAMMHALDRRYYVSLVSAAELHGAAQPAHEPERFQVMVDRHLTSRDFGTTELWFHRSRYLRYDIGIDQHDGPTGPLRLASRELTAIDLAEHVNDCGGIHHIAALLDTLLPLRISNLVEIAATRDTSTIHRLGHLLRHLDPNLYLHPLAELADLRQPTPTDLAPGAPRRGHIDPYWNVRVNVQATVNP